MTTNPELQHVLIQAAKAGNIQLMRELIKFGANPFALDEKNYHSLYYAQMTAPDEANALWNELLGRQIPGEVKDEVEDE